MKKLEWTPSGESREVSPLTELEREQINAELANYASLVDAETMRVNEKYWQAVEAVREAGVPEEELMKDANVRDAFAAVQAAHLEIEETEQEARERLEGFRRAVGV